jgi:hypothetical protein
MSVGASAFYEWGREHYQTINVQGHANQQSADAAWGANWRRDIYSGTTINYNG